MTRILVVDDHTLFREGLAALLESAPGIEVVGVAGSGGEAVAMALDQQPDVILMDIMMPEMNGIQATRRILQAHPATGIIMLTMLEDDDSLFAAMCAGARGYILKGADKAEVLAVIRGVAEGRATFGPAIAARLTHFFRRLEATPRQANIVFPELTEREREVLEMIALGADNQKISETLVISPKTVSNHISNIFSKLQVADRANAIIRAREAGLGAGKANDVT
ncbi:MAG: response regulator transcription factor [Caldilineaceae bacterium]|nr:response regulator transcription factor [Caldilineaceae bacterium]